MSKSQLKPEFVRLRSEGYTLDEICYELDISKPTAIKWNKQLKPTIEQRQRYMMADIFTGRIGEMDEAIRIRMETYKKIHKSDAPEYVKYRANKRVTKWMEKLFNKKIKEVKLEVSGDTVTGATFIFLNEDEEEDEMIDDYFDDDEDELPDD